MSEQRYLDYVMLTTRVNVNSVQEVPQTAKYFGLQRRVENEKFTTEKRKPVKYSS